MREVDSAIVAAKLVNKAGRTAKHAPGTGPESVSQALDRMRKVAKERKKEKFTALFHHLSVDLLEQWGAARIIETPG